MHDARVVIYHQSLTLGSFLTPERFIFAACLNSCKMDDDKYLKQAFDHIDKTGTGTIERVDIKRLMGDDTTEEEVDTVFAEVGSTAVDYPTFAKMCHKKPKMRRVSCLTRVMAP